MASREQSATTDADRSVRSPSRRTSTGRLLGGELVSGANKRSVLGLLALLVGAAAAATPDGLLVGVPLLAAGIYLAAYPLLAASRRR